MLLPKRYHGFTVVEILIVLILVAVLTILITPSFRYYIVRANRSDAIKSILAIQLAEEKYRLSNTTYGTLAQVWSGTDSIDGLYTMSVSDNTATAYTITATAKTAQSGDSECTTMTLVYANGSTTKTPSTCW